MSTRAQLDNLLAFYDEHKPAMKGKAVSVHLARATVLKFAKKEGEKLMYRGYEIVPLDTPRSEK